MIDFQKMSGEIRKSILSILRSFKREVGENGSGYLFDFSKKIAPHILVQDGVSPRYYRVECSSVDLDDDNKTIRVYLESDDDNGLEYDCWVNLNEACVLTEVFVYKAIIDQLFADHRKWLVQQEQFYNL